MRPFLLLAATLLPLAACHDRDAGTSMTITDDNGHDVASANGKTGEFKLDVPGFQGTIKLPKLELTADNFDLNGVHLYPGSKISGFNVSAGSGKSDGNVRVAFTSPAPPTTVRNWLQGRLNEAKFDVRPAGEGLVGTTDEHKSFRLDLAPDGSNAAKGTILIGS